MPWIVAVSIFGAWIAVLVLNLPDSSNVESRVLAKRIRKWFPELIAESRVLVKRIRKWFPELADETTKQIFAFGALGLVLSALIYIYINGWNQKAIGSLFSSFTSNLTTEFVSIIITILILDKLNAKRLARQEKEHIIRQMGSLSNEFALDAVRLIRHNDWHRDGSLIRREFIGANLQDADLSSAVLQKTFLQDAKLQRADLCDAKLQEAELQEANLQKADLSGAYLCGADLSGGCLENAILLSADLRKAYLHDTILKGADLQHADLRGAYLQGADLQDTELSKTKLQGAFYSESTTKWPSGFEPKSSGAIIVNIDE